MRDYVIVTDSSCDLPATLAQELELTVVPLSVLIGGVSYTNYLDEREISCKEFYKLLRSGITASTSAPNVDQFTSIMEPFLQNQKDILYLAFSSGLSATVHAAEIAAKDLSEQYPDARIEVVDTLCASLGEGLLVSLAVKEKRAGKSLDEVLHFVEELKPKLCHWFTVDDLNHLKRGGRVSATTALLGTALSIKPVLHVDDEGHLIPMEKVKGRKNSLKKLLHHMQDTVINPTEQSVFISHGDCEEDANFLADMIRDQLGVKEILISPVGPVIGTHSGPGTMALFFIGRHRS